MFIFSAQLWNRLAKFICALSVVFMIIGAVFALYDLSYIKKTVLADAVITDLIEKEHKNGQTLYATVYVFEDQNGKQIEIQSNIATQAPVGSIGDSIEILYLPNDPTNSIENRFFSKWGISLVIGGMGLFYFLIFGTVVYFTGRQIEKNHANEETAAML